jgi:hypothetical protein
MVFENAPPLSNWLVRTGTQAAIGVVMLGSGVVTRRRDDFDLAQSKP